MASLAAAMRMGNNGDMSGGAQGSTGQQQQGVQATGPEQTLRMHQAEALLRTQAEAALRLAVSISSVHLYTEFSLTSGSDLVDRIRIGLLR